MGELRIERISGGVVFTAKVAAGSSRTGISGRLGDMIKIKVSTPAEKGQANRCLREFLAKLLGARKKDVSIVSGRSSPVKRVRVLGMSAATLSERLRT